MNSNKPVYLVNVCKPVRPVDICRPVWPVDIRKPFFVDYWRHFLFCHFCSVRKH